MSFLLFQLCLVLYLLAAAAYLVVFFSGKRQIRPAARALFLAAAIVHTVAVVARYLDTGHTPITSMHETVSFLAWSVSWSFLLFRWRCAVRNLGVFVSVLVFALMMIAAVSSRKIQPLAPALQSWWLPVHTSVSLVAYAFLALAFLGAVMYLLQEHELKRKRFGFFYLRLPSLESTDKLNHYCLSIGFPLLTLGLITGSLWAKQAWGTYWHWDPKETWSLITWLLYAAVLHQRFTVGWRGRRAAVLSIIAFLSVLFTLWGVTCLLPGLHTYAA
ncbi:MAG: c-type cytochrome biogenesis protein CcsB [Desulfobulbus propionicus]|nr:MAG: c-type cytochrome biogenesis protein CcsB [Desulfobulbus propionicus]